MTNTPRTVGHAVSNVWGTVDGLGARLTWYGDPNAAAYSNTHYHADQQKGMWLATTSAVQLNQLFSQVASSLLRISQ